MKCELNFQPNYKYPQIEDNHKDYLLIDSDQDYLTARAMFDEGGDFLCFIVDAIGNSGYPLHPHEYIAWSYLPKIL